MLSVQTKTVMNLQLPWFIGLMGLCCFSCLQIHQDVESQHEQHHNCGLPVDVHQCLPAGHGRGTYRGRALPAHVHSRYLNSRQTWCYICILHNSGNRQPACTEWPHSSIHRSSPGCYPLASRFPLVPSSVRLGECMLYSRILNWIRRQVSVYQLLSPFVSMVPCLCILQYI